MSISMPYFSADSFLSIWTVVKVVYHPCKILKKSLIGSEEQRI